MQLLLLPLTFLSKFFNAHAFFIASLPILWMLFKNPLDIKKIIPRRRTIVIWVIIIFLQILAMLISFPYTSMSAVPIGIVQSVVLLLKQVVMIWMIYSFTKLYITNQENAVKFIRWALYGYAIYAILVIMPEVLITIGVHSLDGYINTLASVFETRWAGRTDFYQLGSYAVTQGRVNGFEGESPVFANLLGVVYLPIIIGLLIGKDKLVFKKPKIILWVMVIVSGIFLLMAKTTTGILTIALLYLAWLILADHHDRKLLFLLGLVGIAAIALAYVFVTPVHNVLTQFLFEKQGTSNRLGGTIGLIFTFLSTPFLGTGQGFAGYFITEFIPTWSTHNWEYENVYSKLGYPVLSGFFGWLAQYGLIIMVPLLFFVTKYIIDLINRRKQYIQAQSDNERFYYSMLNSSLVTFSVLIPSSFLSFDIFKWSMFLMLFFYWRVLSLSADNQTFPEHHYIFKS